MLDVMLRCYASNVSHNPCCWRHKSISFWKHF